MMVYHKAFVSHGKNYIYHYADCFRILSLTPGEVLKKKGDQKRILVKEVVMKKVPEMTFIQERRMTFCLLFMYCAGNIRLINYFCASPLQFKIFLRIIIQNFILCPYKKNNDNLIIFSKNILFEVRTISIL